MATRIYWFTAVAGYIIQTKCFSNLQTRENYEDAKDEKMHQGLMVVLSFMYFASWLLLPVISRLFDDREACKKRYSPAPLGFASSSSDLELQTFDEEPELVNDTAELMRNNDNKSEIGNKISFKYIAQLVTLSVLGFIPMLAYMMALSMSPGFDIALIQNTSVFEITSLLYGVCGLTKRRNVVTKFLIMMIALIGILIVSYTKATCDLLAGKLSINEKTGELNDPFLFDRLKSSLLCGLGALTIGPFAVLWHRWFNKRSKQVTMREQAGHLSIMGVICMVLLLPFFPTLAGTISSIYKDKSFWLVSMAALIFGTFPHVVSLLQVTRKTTPEYSTTINLGAIIFMGIADWICEPTQTTIVRWEVIGYIMLSVCCIMLSIAYYHKDKIGIHH
ncbi:hypothetical protein HG537_0D03870 [Torulaspora globosa]|uniref:EamA domain-containing protein n=1 Tax=Torulaspora globosa TaxID=48254 RepID=A0A7H9HTH8_9SACH|nr:hypothetical protein HG537_0D03870 [Torulaspora sp. CBS 2947]